MIKNNSTSCVHTNTNTNTYLEHHVHRLTLGVAVLKFEPNRLLRRVENLLDLRLCKAHGGVQGVEELAEVEL